MHLSFAFWYIFMQMQGLAVYKQFESLFPLADSRAPRQALINLTTGTHLIQVHSEEVREG